MRMILLFYIKLNNAHELEHCSFCIKKQLRYSDRITTGALSNDPVTLAIN